MNKSLFHFFLLGCALLFGTTMQGQSIAAQSAVDNGAIQMLRAFYQELSTDSLGSYSYSSGPYQKYCTKTMMAKAQRISDETDGDPALRAQDISEYLMKSLTIKPLGGNWYQVSYMSPDVDDDNDSVVISIPLRVALDGDTYKIDYITPSWDGQLFGDSLCLNVTRKAVDVSSAETFLRSFYEAYAAEYILMPEDLDTRLLALRTQYTTPQAVSQFEEAKKQAEDFSPRYDLIINGYDFDALWLGTMKIEKVNETTYRVSFTNDAGENALLVTLSGQPGAYKIDGIANDSQ